MMRTKASLFAILVFCRGARGFGRVFRKATRTDAQIADEIQNKIYQRFCHPEPSDRGPGRQWRGYAYRRRHQ